MTVAGPARVRLRSSSVQTLALALHELAAQALVHGALSVPEGRLSVRWDVIGSEGPSRLLVITWKEATPITGHAMQESDTLSKRDRQFCRELIERALPYQLNAETAYTVSLSGLECRIALPITPSSGATDFS